MVSYPLIKEGQRSHKYAFLRVSGATPLRLRASLKRVNGAIILENGLVPPCSILLYGNCISSLSIAFLLLRHREIHPRNIRGN